MEQEKRKGCQRRVRVPVQRNARLRPASIARTRSKSLHPILSGRSIPSQGQHLPFPLCGTRRIVRAYAVPPILQPLQKSRNAFICHRQRHCAIPRTVQTSGERPTSACFHCADKKASSRLWVSPPRLHISEEPFSRKTCVLDKWVKRVYDI